jgi:UDP-N-acetylmuramate--alanine ligase
LLLLTPTITVLTNIDADHLDFFTGGIEQIKNCFADFTNRVPFYGTNVLCLDDANVQAIIPAITRRTITYGRATQADVSAWDIKANKNFGSEFTVRAFGHELGTMRINVPGLHNVYNSLAAVAVGLDLNIPFEEIVRAMSEFGGAERRFQIKGEVNDILVVDDYGHQSDAGSGAHRRPSRSRIVSAASLFTDARFDGRFCALVLRSRCLVGHRYLCGKRRPYRRN